MAFPVGPFISLGNETDYLGGFLKEVKKPIILIGEVGITVLCMNSLDGNYFFTPKKVLYFLNC